MKLAACQMQPTGEAWLGKIPAAWNFKRLKYCIRTVTEKVDKTPEDRSYVGLESVESGTGRLVDRETPLTADGGVSLFERDDILFGKLRPYLAKAWHATTAGACTSELLVMRPKQLEPRFLLYSVLNPSFIQAVNGSTYGAQMPRASWDFIGNLPQPVPPTAEQKRIAAFLDAKLGRLDELMRKKERQLALLADKRQALISHAVTRGLNANAPTKHSGIEWLGNIPAHWDVKRLKYVAASVQTGSTPPTSEARLFSEDGVKWFTPGDFSPDGRLTDSARYVSEAAVVEGFVERFSAPVILIVSIGATLGKIGLSEDDCCCNQQINAVRIRQPNSSYYFCHLLTVLAKFMMASANQATLPIFNQTQARNLPVLAPPPEEQATIVAWLDGQLTRMARTADLVARQLTKLHEYRQSLITAAVTGQVAIPEEAA
jgi:type I restriction enzyme S subunit